MRAGSVQIEQDNFRPGLCEPGCDHAANPTCGAGDAGASLRIECESTRFGAHDAALREIRVAPRRLSKQRVKIESLTRLSHLPLIRFLQERRSPMRPERTDLSGFTAMASTQILCALGAAFAGSDPRTYLPTPFYPAADRSVLEECRPGDQECHRSVQ